MAQTVFLLHGMGVHEDTWANTYIEQLKTLWGSYTTLADRFPIDQTVKFVGIRYDSIFEKHRKAWADAGKSVFDALAEIPGGPNLDVAKLVEVSDKLKGSAFSLTHLLDVALFWSHAGIRAEVLHEVNAKITEYAPKDNQQHQFSVVAHSLGTSVIQRALHARVLEGFKDNLLAPDIRVHCLMMVSNVSRILEGSGGGDVYSSYARPSPHPSRGVCNYYYNVRNQWDPIWWPKAFDPAGSWAWEGDPTQRRFEHLQFTHLVSKNPHDLTDYLAHPLVHGTLFRRLTRASAIPASELDQRIAKHELKLKDNLLDIGKQLAGLKYEDCLESLFELMQKIDSIVAQ